MSSNVERQRSMLKIRQGSRADGHGKSQDGAADHV